MSDNRRFRQRMASFGRLPAMIVDVMKAHLVEFPAERNELVFRGPLGASLRRNNFHRSVHWSKIVVEASLPAGFHFHDLRHTGNNLAASSGASTRELMYRMGHGSMRAALIYSPRRVSGTARSPMRSRS
jgi:integrase